MNELKYWVAFHQVSGLGPATFAKLEARFGDLESAWHAPLSDLVAAGVPRKVAGETERFRNENEPDEVKGGLDTLGITALHLRRLPYPTHGNNRGAERHLYEGRNAYDRRTGDRGGRIQRRNAIRSGDDKAYLL